TAGVGLLVLLVTGEAFRPGVILGEIGPAIASVIERTGAVVPAIVLGAAALAGWWIYTKFVKGDEPRDIVVKAVEQQRGE
ncbi:hypothetical protein ACJBQ4_10960, partial [Streptococcus suis]